MTLFCSIVLDVRKKYIEHIYNGMSCTNFLVLDVLLLPSRAAFERDSRWEPGGGSDCEEGREFELSELCDDGLSGRLESSLLLRLS